MWLPWLAVIAGLALLAWSADRFVLNAAAVARNLNISPLIIGMTIMGFGTSAPEVLVAVMASLAGTPGVAIGNAVGSNIANIGMVVGITALIAPLTVRSVSLRREFPVLIIVTLLVVVLCFDNHLGRLDGAVMIIGVIAALGWLLHIARRPEETDPLLGELTTEIPSDKTTGRAVATAVAALILLLVSSRLLVWGAVEIASFFGVSELVIGLTVIAIGTSLPELASSIAAAAKGEDDLLLGNIIGSNLFNSLMVLGIPGLLAPSALDNGVLLRDLPVMVGLTIALYSLSYHRRDKDEISRRQGALLLAAYVAYMIWLGLSGWQPAAGPSA